MESFAAVKAGASRELLFRSATESAAAVESGRNPEDIKLMAVTKTVEPVFINHAIECGIDLIGENKVQEFLSKKPYLKLDNCKAHLIGHLQTNKVRQIVGEVDMIQSVDSVRVAKEISKRAQMAGITVDCLIEINIGEEESKTGLDMNLLYETVDEIRDLPGLNIKGLMTISVRDFTYEQNYELFSRLGALAEKIRNMKIQNVDMQELSMGMTHDYQAAIAAGATIIRVGTAIFGERVNY